MNTYFIFDSLSQVMQAEKECKKLGFNVNVRIIPRHMSSDCGVCIVCNSLFEDGIVSIINDIGVKIKAIQREENG